MTVYDLIFMACLSLNQGSQCKQQMLTCVLQQRDAEVTHHMQNSDFKKMTPDQFLNSQPQADWQKWVLDCAQKQKPQEHKK